MWTKSVEALNHLHAEVYPRILEKGTTGNWQKVTASFPESDSVSPGDLEPGYEALNFLEEEMGNIDPSKANPQEKSALDIYNLTKHFNLAIF